MGLGMPEILLILVIALIVFGPRKLPELGKSLGQAMSQFRKASDDFKRTWEQEVELEKVRSDGSSQSYHSTESYDAYNPYASDTHSDHSEPAQLPQPQNEHAVNSASSSGQDQAHAETVVAAKTPEKKHWI